MIAVFRKSSRRAASKLLYGYAHWSAKSPASIIWEGMHDTTNVKNIKERLVKTGTNELLKLLYKKAAPFGVDAKIISDGGSVNLLAGAIELWLSDHNGLCHPLREAAHELYAKGRFNAQHFEKAVEGPADGLNHSLWRPETWRRVLYGRFAGGTIMVMAFSFLPGPSLSCPRVDHRPDGNTEWTLPWFQHEAPSFYDANRQLPPLLMPR
jgi:hypothetical protein